MRPYMDVVLGAFGPERVMLGSDWPVCTLAAPYEPTLQVAMGYIGTLTPHEQQATVGANAARAYGLDLALAQSKDGSW